MDAMGITWALYESGDGGLWGRVDDDDRAYELDGGMPNSRLESVSVRDDRVSGPIARFDGYALVERLTRGGLAAREFCAATLGYQAGEKSARATWASLNDSDELDGNEALTRDEAEEMAAACAASAIAHGEIEADDRDEYERACAEAHLAAWPGTVLNPG